MDSNTYIQNAATCDDTSATHCNTLQHKVLGHEMATHQSRNDVKKRRQNMQTVQCSAAQCSALQCAATRCNALQRTTAHCSAQQRTAAHCNTLLHSAATKKKVKPKHGETVLSLPRPLRNVFVNRLVSFAKETH